MKQTSELIAELRKCAQGLDFPLRFQILDACDRLERKTRDNELLIKKIAELKRMNEHKTNADLIRARNDHELAEMFSIFICDINEGVEYSDNPNRWLDWLQQPAQENK